MRLWLSGEGPADLGATHPGPDGDEFIPGPMAHIVDRLVTRHLDYSLLELHRGGGDCVRHIPETELARHGKKGSMLLPGVKFGKHNLYFTRNAQVLGLMAKDDALNSGQPAIAVLFRDSDGTQSVGSTQWQQKFDSIKRGFEIVEFPCGVPMVPRPKSEAWLLCGLNAVPHADCAQLEEASGNDNSRNSLKHRLTEALGHVPGAREQASWVETGRIDPFQIDMPSFNAFRTELDRALDQALA